MLNQQQVIIGPKYQVVIPKTIRETLDIKPGNKILVSSAGPYSIKLTIKPNNWINQSYGSSKDAWGTNSDQYLKKLRNSWKKRSSQI